MRNPNELRELTSERNAWLFKLREKKKQALIQSRGIAKQATKVFRSDSTIYSRTMSMLLNGTRTPEDYAYLFLHDVTN